MTELPKLPRPFPWLTNREETRGKEAIEDPNANVPGAHFVTIDTWQKQSGKWKVLAGASISTEPIPAEAYKMPAPGAPN